MLGGANGLRVHRVCRTALASKAHFTASSSLGSQAGVATPEANAAAVAAKKTSRATYWFFGVAAAAVIGTLAYPQLVALPPPQKPAPLPPPLVIAPTPVPPKPVLSPREDLNQRLAMLKAELAELRKQKRSQIVDMKKASIKDEIKMIESGISKLEKA